MSKANKDGHPNTDEILIGYSGTGDITGFVAGAGTAVVSGSKYAGKTGTTAYTLGDVVTALKQIGVLAP